MITFDQEEILPAVKRTVDLKTPIGDQTSKRPRDFRGRVENTQSARQLGSFIECGQIENDAGIESRLCHPQEPSGGHDAAKIRGTSADHRHASEDDHGTGQDVLGAKLLGEHVHGRAGEDKRDVEDGKEDIVLVSVEVEVRFQVVRFRIS